MRKCPITTQAHFWVETTVREGALDKKERYEKKKAAYRLNFNKRHAVFAFTLDKKLVPGPHACATVLVQYISTYSTLSA